MYNLFKFAFAFAIAFAVGYFLYKLLAYAVIYLMEFVVVAAGVAVIFQWALIACFQIFIPVYIAGLILAWLYNRL